MKRKISSLIMICIMSLLGTISSSCSNSQLEVLYSLDELQNRRESGTLSTLVGRRVLVYGQITCVYRSNDSRQGFYTIQNGFSAMFGDFSQNISSTSLLQKGSNVFIHATFHDFPSFNDLILSVSDSNNYVEKCNTNFNVNYFNERSSSSDMLRYFGCMFRIENFEPEQYKNILNYGSGVMKLMKPFFNIDMRFQLYPGCDAYDINQFNISIWCDRVLKLDTPLIIKEYNGYLICSIINLGSLTAYWVV